MSRRVQGAFSRSHQAALPALALLLALPTHAPVHAHVHANSPPSIVLGPRDSGRTIDCAKESASSIGFSSIRIQFTIQFSGDTVIAHRPENITIRNCTIRGTVQIWGLGPSSQPEGVAMLRKTSRRPDFTILARMSAPTNIRFERCRFELTRATGVYVGVGATYVSVASSLFVFDAEKVKKRSGTPIIYLDHESTAKSIVRNRFRIANQNYAGQKMRSREIIAIDGSSDNLIEGNSFADSENGGIFLYRNCGERGVVRHSLPVNNKIIGNTFHYRFDRGKGAIIFGTRDFKGKQTCNPAPNKGPYCGCDSDSNFGSGRFDQSYVISNYAYDNVVCQRVPRSDVSSWIGPGFGGSEYRNFDNSVLRNAFVAPTDPRCGITK